MSYTGTEIFEQSIVIIDELSPTGTVNDTQVKEYKYRAPRLLDMWQKEMAKSGDLFKTFEISCFRKNNLLGDTGQFQAIEHTSSDQIYEAVGANCFFFGVDDTATVYIEEEIGGVWTALNGTYISDGVETALTGTINATGNTSLDYPSFKYYKGILTLTSQTNKVRLRFSGDYYYRHTNRALCSYKYDDVSKVPDFMPWYKVIMPDDFKNRTQIVNEYPNWQYEDDTYRKWEGKNELYVNFAYEGIIRIKYVPVPAKITALTQTLEVDDVTATSGAYYLAEHFAMADQNDSLARRCKEKFKELKTESMIKQPLSPQQITDFYGGSG